MDKNECRTAVQATQVAEAMWRSKETFTEWTEIKLPIKYLTNDRPEKCNVIISKKCLAWIMFDCLEDISILNFIVWMKYETVNFFIVWCTLFFLSSYDEK